MQQEIDFDKILRILGAKEVEINLLRERVTQLETYIKNTKNTEEENQNED